MNSRIASRFNRQSNNPKEIARQMAEIKQFENHPFTCSCGRMALQTYVYPGELYSKENNLYCKRCYHKLTNGDYIPTASSNPSEQSLMRSPKRLTHSEIRREKRNV